ncbi:MAG: hypothetical protein H0U71_00435 [Gammaproteobacteria bacterium]|nr:hypothetical protein [Gammaproteobacteria bacterium]
MPYYDKNSIDNTLKLKSTDDHSEITTTYQTTGPDSYYDSWLGLIENNANAWIAREGNPQRNGKIKIIISSTYFRDTPPDQVVISFLNQLLTYHHIEIYLWLGKDIRFAVTKPISNSVQLWETRQLITPMKEEHVKQALSHQGQSLDGIKIIDDMEYDSVISILNQRLNFTLTLPFPNNDLRKYLENIDLSKLTCADLSDIIRLTQEEVSVLQSLPNITDLIIKIDTQFYNKHFAIIGHINSSGRYKKIAIKTDKYKKIQMISKSSEVNDLVKIDLVDSSNNILEELNLRFVAIHSLDLWHAKKLRRLTISESSVKNIDFTNAHNLEELVIQNNTRCNKLKVLDLNNCRSLKKLILKNPTIQSIIFAQNTVLSYLEIDDRLQSLKITNPPSTDNYVGPAIFCGGVNNNNYQAIEVLKKIHFTNADQLKQFKVTRCLTSFKIPQELQSFTLDITEAEQLEELSLNSSRIKLIGEHKLGVLPIKNLELPTLDYQQTMFILNIIKSDLTGIVIHELNDDVIKLLSNHEKLNSLTVTNITSNIKLSKIRNLTSMIANGIAAIPIEIDIMDCNHLMIFKTPNQDNIRIIGNFNARQKELKLNIYDISMHKLTAKKMCLSNPNLDNICDFPNTEFIKIENVIKENISVDNCPLLKVLQIDKVKSNTINLSFLPSLVELRIMDSECESIIFNNSLYNLKVLKIDNCTNIQNIDFTFLPNLEYLCINSCSRITNINFSSLRYLRTLVILDCALAKIDLSRNINLESFTCSGRLEIINIEKLPILKYINITNLQKTTLKINSNHCQKLRDVHIYCHASNLNFKNCTDIRFLLVSNAGPDIEINGITKLFTLKKFVYAGLLKMPNYIVYSLPDSCEFVEYSVQSELSHLDVEAIWRRLQDELLVKDSDELTRLNKECPVAIYNSKSRYSPDTKTGKNDTVHRAGGKFSVTFIDPYEAPNPDHYCIEILDQINLQGQQLQFTVNHQSTQLYDFAIEPLTQQNKSDLFDKQDDNVIIVRLVGDDIEPNDFYSLPSKNPIITKNLLRLMTDHSNDISLYWNEKHKHFYFKASKPIPRIVFHYTYSRSPVYDKLPSNAIIESFVPSLLSDDITQCINAAKPNLPKELLFVFDNERPIIEKILSLADYCRFDDVDLDQTTESGTLDNMLQIIIERKGVCRHRSYAMLLLSQYLGVNVQQIISEKHSFCFLFFTLEQGGDLQALRIDLGGSILLDETPIVVREKLLNAALEGAEHAKANLPTANDLILSTPLMPPIDKFTTKIMERIYLPLFRELIASSQISNWDDLLLSPILVPLVKYLKSHDPFVISQQIHEHVKQASTTGFYLYINKPEDFSLYFQCFQINNGKRLLRDGPLKELISQGGVVVINWANFTATQMASYKSILDKAPTILGNPVNKQKIKIIGITDDLQSSCSAFMTRCKLFTFQNDLMPSSLPKLKDNSLNEYTINLHESVQWRQWVLGKINFSGHALELAHGKLVEAIQSGGHLIIINPPINNKAFDELMKRLQYDDYILYNGQKLFIPPSFIITLKHEATLSAKNIIISDKMPNANKKPIHIGLHNIHSCYETLAVANTKATTDTHGLLHNYDDEHYYFYITETLPKSDWNYLNTYVAEHYPNRAFHFFLAPGAAIENVLTNTAHTMATPLNDPLGPIPLDCPMILSNDPDFTASLLAKAIKTAKNQEVEIIYVSPQTTFNSLVLQLDINPQIETGMVEFAEAEGSIIKALSKNKIVILCGELSYGSCQKLNSFYSKQGYYYKNGKRIELSDPVTVYSIQPHTVKFTGISQYQLIQYQFEDYKKVIDATLYPYLDQIIQFKKFAKFLPLGGEGRPLNSHLSFKRIERMIKVIRLRPRHPHNPIKGLFHYDYPRNSQDYAYLNVIAKIAFSNTNVTFVTRIDKLNTIKNGMELNTLEKFRLNIWHVLNCFSKLELLNIIGHDLSSIVTFGYPTIEQSKLELAWNYFNSVTYTSSDRPVTSPTVSKREQQLSELIKDDTTHIIMVKGAPGVGKTRTARQLIRAMNLECYEGEADIEAWKSDQRDSVLLLDEANMAIPGTWDSLKGFINQHKKIVATCNPETFNRYYHDLFQQYAETIYFSMPVDSYIQNKILEPLLLECLNENNANVIASDMLLVYNLAKKYNPTYFYSTRDLENLCQRFIVLYQQQNNAHTVTNEILYSSCVSEFAGTIFYPDVRQKFNAELSTKFGVSPQPQHEIIKVSDTCLIPSEKSYIIDCIKQCILIRNKALAAKQPQPQPFYYKRGVLLEGDAGLGKSYLIKALLEKFGFENHSFSSNNNTHKYYYELSVSDDDAVRGILIKANLEGSAVILDELNLGEELEALLLKLLMGENVITENDTYYLKSFPKKDELPNYKNSYICLKGGHVYYINNQGTSASPLISDIAKYQLIINKLTPSGIGLKQSLSSNDYKNLVSLFIPKPGLIVFGSQNPSSVIGRKSLSSALRNRLQVIYMEGYLRKSLIAIARESGIPEPEAFVAAYLKMHKNEPDITNMRTFYSALSLAQERGVTYEGQIKEINDEVEITPPPAINEEKISQTAETSNEVLTIPQDVKQEHLKEPPDLLMVLKNTLPQAKIRHYFDDDIPDGSSIEIVFSDTQDGLIFSFVMKKLNISDNNCNPSFLITNTDSLLTGKIYQIQAELTKAFHPSQNKLFFLYNEVTSERQFFEHENERSIQTIIQELANVLFTLPAKLIEAEDSPYQIISENLIKIWKNIHCDKELFLKELELQTRGKAEIHEEINKLLQKLIRSFLAFEYKISRETIPQVMAKTYYELYLVTHSLLAFQKVMTIIEYEKIRALFQPLYQHLEILMCQQPSLYTANNSPYPILFKHMTNLCQELQDNRRELAINKNKYLKIIEKSSYELDRQLYGKAPMNKKTKALLCGLLGALVGFVLGATIGAVATAYVGGCGGIITAAIGAAKGFSIGTAIGASSGAITIAGLTSGIGIFNSYKKQNAFKLHQGEIDARFHPDTILTLKNIPEMAQKQRR